MAAGSKGESDKFKYRAVSARQVRALPPLHGRLD
jgi:hypothetical protein